MFAQGNYQHKQLSLPTPLPATNKHPHTLANTELTFACFHALEPTVSKFTAAGISTILVPTAAGSATTGST